MTYRSSDGESGLAETTSTDATNPPSTRVAYRLAEESGRPIDGLRPLADAIDPEALDDVFAGRDTPEAYVTFQHEGYTVTVTGGGDVLVDPVGEQ